MERDIRDVARIKDSNDVARLLELLALRTAELLNVSSIGNDINVDRQTVERHLYILEKLFLVRILPAWHQNSAKRLIKSPKVHVCDSGLAATLADIHTEDWNTKRDRFGHLLESFVLQQLIAQAGWTDPDLKFWHYRDKDKVEVHCVITRGRKVWGIEVKAAATIKASDGAGLNRLAEQARNDFQGGGILYDGDIVIPLGRSGHLAVPISRLWEY